MSEGEQYEAGFLHRPANSSGAALALTHGAGGNCNAPLLVAIASALAAAGVLAYRYNLAFRRARPQGSPFPSGAKADRESIREALAQLRGMGASRVLAGGLSYGGRQTTMAAAEDGSLADGLLLLSYPLHPPGKPDQLRTAHFPDLKTKALFVHGSKDPFGSVDEMELAIKQIAVPTQLFIVERAGHDLGKNRAGVADEIVAQTLRFLLG